MRTTKELIKEILWECKALKEEVRILEDDLKDLEKALKKGVRVKRKP